MTIIDTNALESETILRRRGAMRISEAALKERLLLPADAIITGVQWRSESATVHIDYYSAQGRLLREELENTVWDRPDGYYGVTLKDTYHDLP